MLQRNHPRAGGLLVRILGSLVILAGLVALMYYTLPKEAANHIGTVTPVETSDKARRCEDNLADLLEGLTPGRLGISSDRIQVIDRLNAWRTECASQPDVVRPGKDVSLIEKLLTETARTRALNDRFLLEDANQIRMSLLSRDIAMQVVEGNISNVSRVVALFDYVIRNVMLIDDAIRESAPITPYEALVFGMGTAEDRAWVFAELLRQLRIDAVILSPQKPELEHDWLIGVIEPQTGILLFDPRLGLPIPAADCPADVLYPNVPATLQSVLESDQLFRQLDVPEFPYPLTAADLKDLSVSLIGSSSSWAPRMALLQFLLPQGFNVDLYDGLGETELRSPGAYQRVVDAGQNGLWSEDQVGIWTFPEQALAKFEATRGEGEAESQLAGLQVVFRGPYVPRPAGNDGKTFQPTPIEKSLHFVRIEQLKGNYTSAIRDYLPVRTTVKLVPNSANESAAEFATLWTGVSQYQTRKITTAQGTLDRYISTQARSIGMARVAYEFLADCLLAQKNYKVAAQALQAAPAGFAPQRDVYLSRRWQRIGGIDPDQTATDQDEQPENSSEMKAPGTGDAPPKAMDAKPDTGAKPEANKTEPPAGAIPSPPPVPTPEPLNTAAEKDQPASESPPTQVHD